MRHACMHLFRFTFPSSSGERYKNLVYPHPDAPKRACTSYSAKHILVAIQCLTLVKALKLLFLSCLTELSEYLQ